MNVIVTGGTGFIGKELIRQIMMNGCIKNIYVLTRNPIPDWSSGDIAVLEKGSGNSIHQFECDLSDTARVHQVMRSLYDKYEMVFHLGADPMVKLNKQDETRVTRSNVLGTHNLLANCKEGTKFVFASSATIYGDEFGDDTKEDYRWKPTSIYGWSKLACEELVHQYASMSRVHPLILRYIANVGRNSTHGVVHDLVNKLKKNKNKLPLLGDRPGSCKPYMHVSDTTKITMDLGIGPHYGTYNIAPDDQINIETLANSLIAGLGIKPHEVELVWQGEKANWKGDNKKVSLSNDKVKGTKVWGPVFTHSTQAIMKVGEERSCEFS